MNNPHATSRNKFLKKTMENNGVHLEQRGLVHSAGRRSLTLTWLYSALPDSLPKARVSDLGLRSWRSGLEMGRPVTLIPSEKKKKTAAVTRSWRNRREEGVANRLALLWCIISMCSDEHTSHNRLEIHRNHGGTSVLHHTHLHIPHLELYLMLQTTRRVNIGLLNA